MTVKISDEGAVYIKGAHAYYAKLKTPEAFNGVGDKKYELNLSVSPEDAKALKKFKLNKDIKEIGVDIDKPHLEGKDGDFYFKVTTKEFNSKGVKNKIPVFKDKVPFKGDIGNGSEVSVKLFTWDSKMAPGKKDSMLQVVNVDNLVQYTGSSDGFFDSELGVDLSGGGMDDELGVNTNDFDDDENPFA
jgi:hypothetical protein